VTHQEPEDFQAVFLGQRSQCFYRFFLFHIFTIKEMTKYGKRAGDFFAPDFRGLAPQITPQSTSQQYGTIAAASPFLLLTIPFPQGCCPPLSLRRWYAHVITQHTRRPPGADQGRLPPVLRSPPSRQSAKGMKIARYKNAATGFAKAG
jgi:hypothetical protein